MNSWIRDAFFAKALNWYSVQSDGHGALSGTPALDLFALFEKRDLFNSPVQVLEVLGKAFTKVVAGVGDDLLEKATAMNAVGEQLRWDWSA